MPLAKAKGKGGAKVEPYIVKKPTKKGRGGK